MAGPRRHRRLLRPGARHLIQLLLVDALCRFVLGFPAELVRGHILPGARRRPATLLAAMRLFRNPATRSERRRLVDRAWRRYVQDGGEPGDVAQEISRSWRRSREAYRIDPRLTRLGRVLAPEELHARCERDDVLRLARPILRDFAARLGLWDHVLAYFDGDGWMLSIDGAQTTIEGVAQIDFRPGARWAEDSAGTNGPGTALVERRAVEVFASEHFVAAWHPWSCAAAPIFAPGLATPAGVIDITGRWEVQRRQALLVAKAIARAVEERVRAAASVRDEVVRYAFRAAHESGDALVAVDARGCVLAANDAALRRRVMESGSLPWMVREPLVRALSAVAPPANEIHLDAPDAPGLVASLVTYQGAAVGAIVRAPANERDAAARRKGRARKPATRNTPPAESSAAEAPLGREAAAPRPIETATDAAPPRAAPGAGLRATVLEWERQALVQALDAVGWNFARAAQRLGISRMTLYRRLSKLGIARAPRSY